MNETRVAMRNKKKRRSNSRQSRERQRKCARANELGEGGGGGLKDHRIASRIPRGQRLKIERRGLLRTHSRIPFAYYTLHTLSTYTYVYTFIRSVYIRTCALIKIHRATDARLIVNGSRVNRRTMHYARRAYRVARARVHVSWVPRR